MPGFIAQVTITPPNPTPSDNVTIVVDGSGCSGRQDLVMSRSGFAFTGTLDVGGPLCFAAPPGLHASFTAGRLIPGNYTVTIDQIFAGAVVPQYRTTTTFVVAGDAAPVPTTEPFALALIAVAIVLIAIPRLLRR